MVPLTFPLVTRSDQGSAVGAGPVVPVKVTVPPAGALFHVSM
jgi:hypothetical protein